MLLYLNIAHTRYPFTLRNSTRRWCAKRARFGRNVSEPNLKSQLKTKWRRTRHPYTHFCAISLVEISTIFFVQTIRPRCTIAFQMFKLLSNKIQLVEFDLDLQDRDEFYNRLFKRMIDKDTQGPESCDEYFSFNLCEKRKKRTNNPRFGPPSLPPNNHIPREKLQSRLRGLLSRFRRPE